MLYEMLVGKHPFVNDQDAAETITRNIVENEPDFSLSHYKTSNDGK